MALPFFRALNPISENSGITYCVDIIIQAPCYNYEMIDASVTEVICNAYNRDYNLFAALHSTYVILVGCHYDLNVKGYFDARGGSKGILDILIFPLIARKLIADAHLPENRYNPFSRMLAVVVGLPLEITRLLLGITLTIVVSPLVLYIHVMKLSCGFEPMRAHRIPVDLPPVSVPRAGANSERIKHLDALDIPNEYICPISFDIMTDPVFVTAHPEQRFERSYIEQSLRLKPENPLTREPLSLDGIQADVTMKNEIEQYIQEQLQHAPSQATCMRSCWPF